MEDERETEEVDSSKESEEINPSEKKEAKPKNYKEYLIN